MWQFEEMTNLKCIKQNIRLQHLTSQQKLSCISWHYLYGTYLLQSWEFHEKLFTYNSSITWKSLEQTLQTLAVLYSVISWIATTKNFRHLISSQQSLSHYVCVKMMINNLYVDMSCWISPLEINSGHGMQAKISLHFPKSACVIYCIYIWCNFSTTLNI